jgi:hypothetical protein
MAPNLTLRRDLRSEIDPERRRVALRTAFVARFIVLREGRRSRAHRLIEKISWGPEASAQDLYDMFRKAFTDNGDRLEPVDRDLKRSLEHAERSVDYFIQPYVDRSTLSFKAALDDYQKSNELLFGEGEPAPRSGGWRCSKSSAEHRAEP